MSTNLVANPTSTSAGPGRLMEAQRLFQAGRLAKAARLCEEILRAGMEPAAAAMLGQIRMKTGQPEQGLALLQSVIDHDPSSAPARFALAGALQSAGKPREAAGAWMAGLEIDPRHEPAHIALADILLELHLPDASMAAARNALIAAPQSADAYERLGLACDAVGRRGEAIEHYSKSLEIRPGFLRTAHRLAASLRLEGRLDSARRLLQKMAESHPRDAGTRFLLSGAASEMGLREEAIEDLRRAIALQPRFPEAWNNLGVLLRSGGELSEAEACFTKATSQRPEYAAAWNNLGNLEVELSRLDDAERSYTRAAALQPDYAEAHTSRALVWLLEGRFEAGWTEYEWRWRQPGMRPRSLPQPEWRGESLAGKTILLHAEQGAGDTLQFIRYARILKRGGASVVLHCQESLQTLLSAMPELDTVITDKIPAPAFDVHAPLMSLPRLFETNGSSIPAEVPYLAALPDTSVPEPLRAPYPEGVHLRVGLVWAGNPAHRNDRNRSVPEQLLADVTRTEGVQFFSLQVGSRPENERITDLAPYLTDYAVTAACLAHLDLLITVDTSVAHLAGALGRPVWMLLPTCNDWRWLTSGDTSAWYPTMRLFRQSRRGDWAAVAGRVRSELEQSRDVLSAQVRS